MDSQKIPNINGKKIASFPINREKTINVTPMPGETAVYTLFEGVIRRSYLIANLARAEKKNALILPTGPQEEVVCRLLHVWTDPKHTRKGCATDLIKALKQHADTIYGEPLTEDGRALMEACGFKKADNLDIYRWKR